MELGTAPSAERDEVDKELRRGKRVCIAGKRSLPQTKAVPEDKSPPRNLCLGHIKMSERVCLPPAWLQGHRAVCPAFAHYTLQMGPGGRKHRATSAPRKVSMWRHNSAIQPSEKEQLRWVGGEWKLNQAVFKTLICHLFLFFQVKCEARLPLSKTKNNNSNCKKGSNENKSKISVGEECRADEQAFLVALYKYMKERKTPIERIPYLGFKQSK